MRAERPLECGWENRTDTVSKHVLLKIREGKQTVGYSSLARVLEESKLNNE